MHYFKNGKVTAMAMDKKHMVEIGRKTQFTPDNQPLPEAKSGGWKNKNLEKEARKNILRQMYKQAGFNAEGESELDITLAQQALTALQEGDIQAFLSVWKDVLPSKPTENTIKGDAENPIPVNLGFVNVSTKDLEKLLKGK